MLPRYRCSLLLAEKRLAYRFTGPQDSVARRRSLTRPAPKTHQRRSWSHGWAKLDLVAFARNSPNHEDYLGHLRTCVDHRHWRDLCGRRDDKQSDRSRGP
jgi:hypothetical protein